MTEKPKLTKKDFVSNQDVKWCPGCGDYAILSATQMAMAQIGVEPHNVCVVSGIGCSSRFPYYVNSYGMHSIHGRAPAVATGVKLQNPELSVWVITGDGDGLSIGGNHLAHIIRRNVNVNIILFNNEIYGLTKGQYSPTSSPGLKTKSTPYGSLDRSFSPIKFALGAGASFFARTIDTDPKHMIEVFKAAHAHEGTSVIEVFQNCVIFNDKVHDQYTHRNTRDEHTIRLEHGKQMIYGKEKDKALVQDGFALSPASLDASTAYVHDESDAMLTQILANLDGTNGPIPLGVLRKLEQGVYDQDFHTQINEQKTKLGEKKVQELLLTGKTWKVG